MTRTEQLAGFLKAVEKFKQVKRAIPLSDSDKYEDDAQHVWHTLMFLLVPDLPEIHAGDTFAFDATAQDGKHDREQTALTRVLATLPADVARELETLRHEFETNETVEAKLAHALDKLQPILQNICSDGRAWRHHNLTYEQVDAHKRPRMEGFEPILELYESLMAESKTMFKPARD